jgi:hypothetical protein
MDFPPVADDNARMNAILFDTLRLSRTLRGPRGISRRSRRMLSPKRSEKPSTDLMALETKVDTVEAALEAKIGMVDAGIARVSRQSPSSPT